MTFRYEKLKKEKFEGNTFEIPSKVSLKADGQNEREIRKRQSEQKGNRRKWSERKADKRK